MSVTIRDVAKAAGVSTATVSRVINDSGYVREHTRKAVLDAIEKLNYRPNEVARSLYKKTSKLIGLVLPDIMNPFFPALARGVEDYLYEQGYQLIIGNSDEKNEKEIEYVETFLQNNVVGLILITHEIDVEELSKRNIPVVLLDRTLEEFPAVYADHVFGGRLSATEILKRGCKEVALIRGPINIRPVCERFQSALNMLQQADIQVNIIDSALTFQGGEQAAVELFQNYPNTDSVIACNDMVAIEILNEAINRGYKVPNDLQIIGYDDIYISNHVNPGLSTVRQPIYEMGQKAAELLMKQINQQRLEKLHYTFSVTFIERKSTRKVLVP